jgi:hypothetical protein
MRLASKRSIWRSPHELLLALAHEYPFYRTQNVTAVTAIANIVKSSLGPVGLDKVWNLKAGI